MAAALTVSQLDLSGKSHISKSGVLAVHGFGVRIRMQSGHLEIQDGIGPERRRVRLPRVGHGLKRLVCISEDGFVTLDALKWLGDQKASFIMLDRNGKVFLVTGPTGPSDARLRRAQALARQTGVALAIMREVIGAKIRGQQELVQSKLNSPTAADRIAKVHAELSSAEDLDTVAHCESQAASAYWSAWTTLPISFPRQDARRVPAHWLGFGTRKSMITGSQRLATNPPGSGLRNWWVLLSSAEKPRLK
jgi:CRISPR/Cas system-associated endonuclease Cas1